MVGLMVESAQPLLRKWEECIEAQGGMTANVEVDEDLRGVSADVISRACFGRSSYKGKQIFSKLRSLQKAISKNGFLFGVTKFGYMLSSLLAFLSHIDRNYYYTLHPFSNFHTKFKFETYL